MVGKGSNLLFDDRGFNGLVVVNQICFVQVRSASPLGWQFATPWDGFSLGWELTGFFPGLVIPWVGNSLGWKIAGFFPGLVIPWVPNLQGSSLG